MTLSELIQTLQDIQDDQVDGVDPEVRLASQPSWPFEWSISNVVEIADPESEDLVSLQDELSETEDEDAAREIMDRIDDIMERSKQNGPVVYLAEGTQLGYLPGVVAAELGWGR